jgi:hypothetical protein
MSIIDTAVQRLQVIAKATAFDAAHNIGFTPSYPVDDAGVLPMVITHVSGGAITEMNATDTKLTLSISSDVHFNRSNIKIAYQQIDTFIPDFIQRLGGDPTLGGSVSTIIFPVPFVVVTAEWGSIQTQMVQFTIPVKFNLLTPTVTP